MFDEDKKSLYFIHLKKYDNNPEPPESDSDSDNKTDDKDMPKENNVNFWNEYKEYILFGLIFIVLIIGLVFGYIFGRKTLEKKRKARANELEDNYEYIKNNDDKNIKENINE